eukprot:jgi/Ulvmu1/11481/UM077_0025.1
MLLTESETYACGALFVLALYCTSIEAGAHEHGVGSSDGAWGTTLEVIADAYTSKTSRASSGWGWSLISPTGVCGRIFKALDIKHSSAASLLSQPEGVHPLQDEQQRQVFLSLVEAYAHHLDPGLQFEVECSRSAINVAHSSAEDTTKTDDTVEEDVEEPDVSNAATPSPPSEMASTELPSQEELDRREEQALREALTALQDDPEAMQRINAETRVVEDANLTEGTVLCEPSFQASDVYTHKAAAASFQGVREIIAAAIPTAPFTKDTPISTRWYDSRARVAALRVAHWLRVPMPSFEALELELLGDQVDSQEQQGTKDRLKAFRSDRSKWLKVGAAAVGGGVLTAVTAGLAAPAIVAGVGTLVGLTGSAGAAATITGAATSAASVGIVTASSGTAGAAYYSSKMAKRAADISEFGFVRLAEYQAFHAAADGITDGNAHEEGSSPAGPAWTSVPTRYGDVSGPAAAAAAEPGPARQAERSGAAAAAAVDPEAEEGAAGAGQLEQGSASQRVRKSLARGWGWGKSAGKAALRKSQSKLQRSASSRASDTAEPSGAVPAATLPQASPDPLAEPLPLPGMVPGSATAIIAVNGWISARQDFVEPFAALDDRHGNTMALVWESKELAEIHKQFRKMIARSAGQQAVQLALYATVSGLATATMWPVAVLNCATLIDSAFDVACIRAARGGKLLANMLLARLHGDRPITLLGVAMGARLVWYCLLELYRQGARGVVEHAVLLGAPVSIDRVKFRTARSVVSGRFVNGHSETDWLLGLCTRTKIGQGVFKKCAGIRPVQVAGIQDMDFTSIVRSSKDWTPNMQRVLSVLHLDRKRSSQ